ncbi:hypothetical protein CPB85DRAFT_570208 [Mucidula mucida]|nr:hypothetical protein CPB85DRAFT_570208 [Mucidula mucida]
MVGCSPVLQYQGEVETLAIARLTAGYEARGLPVPPATEILDDPRSIFCYVPPVPSGEADVVLRFPAIHAKMRDRQDGRGFRSSCAAEFMSVQEGKVVGGHVGSNTLRVELKLWDCGEGVRGFRLIALLMLTVQYYTNFLMYAYYLEDYRYLHSVGSAMSVHC